ncbi:Uma2 family endonuclease [Spirosoma sp. HMF3257]|uniref:Uma2 family endonuclease n=1 Tax=Spirosoma telluris TaxID=2183553 RepID=A0A327NKJ5_9BACT|nr:Uma2 family endonuclease [Spirosoma telluris]RAI75323.1 Uma2 family endonuclease [Spirosoma telluris]
MEATIEQVSAYELERGKPMPTLNHSYVQKNLLVSLDYRYRKTLTVLSELNLSVPERPDAVPDIAIYPKLQIDFLHDVTSMTQMPLTAIEIVSPSQSDAEILAKFERYFNAGVQSCWLVMPSFQAISVYSAFGKYRFFSENDTLTDALTGIELSLSDIFS